jgi:hypothetical protein
MELIQSDGNFIFANFIATSGSGTPAQTQQYLFLPFVLQQYFSLVRQVELRRIETAEDVATQLAQSRNVVYLPSGQHTLLSLPQ